MAPVEFSSTVCDDIRWNGRVYAVDAAARWAFSRTRQAVKAGVAV
jgi:hypothetical protein